MVLFKICIATKIINFDFETRGRSGRRTDGQTDGRSDGQTHGHTVGRSVGRAVGRTHRQSDERSEDPETICHVSRQAYIYTTKQKQANKKCKHVDKRRWWQTVQPTFQKLQDSRGNEDTPIVRQRTKATAVAYSHMKPNSAHSKPYRHVTRLPIPQNLNNPNRSLDLGRKRGHLSNLNNCSVQYQSCSSTVSYGSDKTSPEDFLWVDLPKNGQRQETAKQTKF